MAQSKYETETISDDELAAVTGSNFMMPDFESGITVANNYVTEFPCLMVARQPTNSTSQTGLTLSVDGVEILAAATGGTSASKRFCLPLYVGKGRKVTYSGDGTITLVAYPLIGSV